MSLFLSQSVLRPRSPLHTDPSHRFVNEISEKSKFLRGDDKNRKNSPFSGRNASFTFLFSLVTQFQKRPLCVSNAWYTVDEP